MKNRTPANSNPDFLASLPTADLIRHGRHVVAACFTVAKPGQLRGSRRQTGRRDTHTIAQPIAA